MTTSITQIIDLFYMYVEIYISAYIFLFKSTACIICRCVAFFVVFFWSQHRDMFVLRVQICNRLEIQVNRINLS